MVEKYFSIKELTCADMDKDLLDKLYHLRVFVGRRIFIYSGYRACDAGIHGEKKAFDIHIENMHVIDQYLVAERFNFGGIGVYPYWRNAGIHIDVREKSGRWGRDKNGRYVALNSDFLLKIPN